MVLTEPDKFCVDVEYLRYTTSCKVQRTFRCSSTQGILLVLVSLLGLVATVITSLASPPAPTVRVISVVPNHT